MYIIGIGEYFKQKSNLICTGNQINVSFCAYMDLLYLDGFVHTTNIVITY